jgi:hypothetical protein
MYMVRKFSFALIRKTDNKVFRYYCKLVLFKFVFPLLYAVNYSRLPFETKQGHWCFMFRFSLCNNSVSTTCVT